MRKTKIVMYFWGRLPTRPGMLRLLIGKRGMNVLHSYTICSHGDFRANTKCRLVQLARTVQRA